MLKKTQIHKLYKPLTILLLTTYCLLLTTYHLHSQELDIELKKVYPKILTPASGVNDNNFLFFDFYDPIGGTKPKLKIYSLQGFFVQEIISEPKPKPVNFYGQGYWHYQWDGKDSTRNFVQPGLYIYQFETPQGKIYNGIIIVAR